MISSNNGLPLGLVSSFVDFVDFFFFLEEEDFFDFPSSPPRGTFLTTHGVPLVDVRPVVLVADDAVEEVVEVAVDAAHAARTIILFAERFFILKRQMRKLKSIDIWEIVCVIDSEGT